MLRESIGTSPQDVLNSRKLSLGVAETAEMLNISHFQTLDLATYQ